MIRRCNLLLGWFGLFLFFWGWLTASAFAFQCNGHLAYGTPSAGDQMLCRDGYAVSYSYEAKQPFWVGYHLTALSVAKKVKRSNHFHEDTEIPAPYRSTLADYRKSGFDRGHLAANATVDFSWESMDQSFLMSNMSPQLPGFNRQGWAYLEAYVRSWAAERGELYVFSGPLFEKDLGVIGHGVRIPSHFWKVIYDPVDQEMIAFIVPHTPFKKADIPFCIVSVDEVERRAGMDFFSVLDDAIENRLEAGRSSLW